MKGAEGTARRLNRSALCRRRRGALRRIEQKDDTARSTPASPDFKARHIQLIEAQRQERDAPSCSGAAPHRGVQCAAITLSRGLRAAWARLNGRYDRLVSELAKEAADAEARDCADRQALIDRHLPRAEHWNASVGSRLLLRWTIRSPTLCDRMDVSTSCCRKRYCPSRALTSLRNRR